MLSKVAWLTRSEPLTPSAAIAIGEAAIALAQRVLALTDEQRARFTIAASETTFVVSGSELPWVDGVVYLGSDPTAEGLLLPTTKRPDVPLDLFARAIYARFPDAPRPLAVLESQRVLPLGATRAVDVAALQKWLEARG